MTQLDDVDALNISYQPDHALAVSYPACHLVKPLFYDRILEVISCGGKKGRGIKSFSTHRTLLYKK